MGDYGKLVSPSNSSTSLDVIAIEHKAEYVHSSQLLWLSIILNPSEVRWSVTELETECFSCKQWTKVKMRRMLEENDMMWPEEWEWPLGKSRDRYLVTWGQSQMVSSSCQRDTIYNHLGMEISIGNLSLLDWSVGLYRKYFIRIFGYEARRAAQC